MAQKSGLGRGLGALLGDTPVHDKRETVETDANALNQVQELYINQLDPNKDQPRKAFEEMQLRELAASIEHSGIIQPLIVKKAGGRYTIIAGERRWRAARMAGLQQVPAIVRDYDELQIMEVALIENLQRSDLNSIEEATGIRLLMRQHDFTQEEVASRLGKSRSAIANAVRLLTLPEQIIELLREDKISAGHAKCIVGIDNQQDQLRVATEIIKKHLSVRQTEALCKTMSQKQTKPEKKTSKEDAELFELQNQLQFALETKVKIAGDVNKGKIIIEYFSQEQLEKLYDYLNSAETPNKLIT